MKTYFVSDTMAIRLMDIVVVGRDRVVLLVDGRSTTVSESDMPKLLKALEAVQ